MKKETSEKETPKKKNPIGVAFGNLGASKGGIARAQKLSKRKRSQIAKRAAEARWSKEKE